MTTLLNLINSFLALPLRAQITLALVIALIIVIGSSLIGLIEDILLLAAAIIAVILVLNFVLPVLGL